MSYHQCDGKQVRSKKRWHDSNPELYAHDSYLLDVARSTPIISTGADDRSAYASRELATSSWALCQDSSLVFPFTGFDPVNVSPGSNNATGPEPSCQRGGCVFNAVKMGLPTAGISNGQPGWRFVSTFPGPGFICHRHNNQLLDPREGLPVCQRGMHRAGTMIHESGQVNLGRIVPRGRL